MGKWLLSRLKERSTWSAIIALASLAGLKIAPELKEQIVTTATGIVALIFALTADSKPAVPEAATNVTAAEPQRIARQPPAWAPRTRFPAMAGCR